MDLDFLDETTASSSMCADKLTSSPRLGPEESAVIVRAVYRKSNDSFSERDERGTSSALEIAASQTARRRPRRLSRRESTSDVTFPNQAIRRYSADNVNKVPLNANFLEMKSIMKVATHAESLSRNSSAQLDKCTELRKLRRLRFSHINVREYERELGDNPSCASGPPLTIGWHFIGREEIIDIDAFEKKRIQERKSSSLQLILSKSRRWEICQDDLGCSEEEIFDAADRATAVRRRRIAAAKDQGWFSDVMEEVRKGAWKKLKKSVSGVGNGGNDQLIKMYVARDHQLLQQYQAHKREEQEHAAEKNKRAYALHGRVKYRRRSSFSRNSKIGKSAGDRMRNASLSSADLDKTTVDTMQQLDISDKAEETDSDRELTKEEEAELLRNVSNVRGFFRHRDSLLDLTMILRKDEHDIKT
jgi:hypothetical protein